MKARAAKPSGKIRKFKVPANLNFDAVEYFELINRTDLSITEQPVFKTMIDTELQQFIVMGVTTIIFFLKFSFHAPAFKRLMKLVTEAFKAVCEPNFRDGCIRVRIAFRQLMPRFESKRDFTHFNL